MNTLVLGLRTCTWYISKQCNRYNIWVCVSIPNLTIHVVNLYEELINWIVYRRRTNNAKCSLKSNNSMHVCDLNGSRLLIELEYIGRYEKDR